MKLPIPHFLFPTRLRGRASFNLVELSLAVATVAIGIISVFGILPHIIKSSRQAVDYDMITLDVQDFIDDTSRRWYVTTNRLMATNPPAFSNFPFYKNPHRETISSRGFIASLDYGTIITTNARATYDIYQSYTSKVGAPILRTVFVTYSWGATNNPTNRQTYTFITEICATDTNRLFAP